MKKILSHLSSLVSHVKSYSDKQLVLKAQDGDSDAFGKLYLRYIDSIYRFLYIRTGFDRQEAEDLTEMVFFNAWGHIHSFKGTYVKAWLFTIARNKLIDYYRRTRKIVTLSERVIDKKTDIDHETYTLMLGDDIRSALTKLTLNQQELIALKYIEGMDNREISRILGKRADALRQQQKRALKRLKQLLMKKGYGNK